MNQTTRDDMEALAREMVLMDVVQILGEHLSRTQPDLSDAIGRSIQQESVGRLRHEPA